MLGLGGLIFLAFIVLGFFAFIAWIEFVLKLVFFPNRKLEVPKKLKPIALKIIRGLIFGFIGLAILGILLLASVLLGSAPISSLN